MEPENEPNPETETETTQAEATDPKPQTEGEPKSEAEAEAGAEPKAEAETEAQPEPLTAETIKVPEGVEVNSDAMGSFIDIMNDTELSPQDRAQKLIDLQVEHQAKAAKELSEAYEQTREEWATQVRNDPEIGGKQLDENLGHVSRLIDEHGTPELREAFDLTGAGDHPEIVKFMVKIGKMFAEGTPTPSASPTSHADDAEARAQRLYDTPKK